MFSNEDVSLVERNNRTLLRLLGRPLNRWTEQHLPIELDHRRLQFMDFGEV